MIIPSSFKLFSQTIKVVYKRDLIEKQGAFAVWNYNRNTIYLQQSTRKHVLSKEQIHQSFVHEATHACLDLMGSSELSNDEKFVHTLSNLIYQLITEIHND